MKLSKSDCNAMRKIAKSWLSKNARRKANLKILKYVRGNSPTMRHSKNWTVEELIRSSELAEDNFHNPEQFI